jgi:hypothetical protein
MAKMDVSYADQKIIVQNHYYPKPEKFHEVLELRIEASKLLKKFGLTAGQVLVTRQTMDRASGKQKLPLVFSATKSLFFSYLK